MQSVKQNLLAAFRYLLKPLVRLAVKNAVTFPDFCEALKKAYVDVAAKQLAGAKSNTAEEGIALIVSIPIGEVRDILRLGDDAKYSQAVQEVSPLPTILGAWHTDQRYTGPYGVLRDLEFESSTGDSATFTNLAAAYCPGISPRALMDELIRVGAVQDVGNGYYRAIQRSYVPEPLSAPSILMLARSVHNISETLELNLRVSSAGGRGLIERSIHTVHGIPKREHAEFAQFVRSRGQIFADDIDNWISARDVEGVDDGMQVGVGFYQYIMNDDDEIALSKELPT